MNANKRGVFSRELVGSAIETKKNQDERRVNMYAHYVRLGKDIPFHLANNEAELSKYSQHAHHEVVDDSDIEDGEE